MIPVDIFRTVDVNIFSLIILCLILVAVNRNYHERSLLSTRLFLILIVLNILLAVIDIFGWVWNDMSGVPARIGNIVSNMLLYVATPLPVAAWFLYAHFQIFGSISRLRRCLLPLIAIIVINAVPAVASPWTGWFFSIDAANHYNRGPWFYLHVALIFGILLATTAMLLLYRRRIDPRHLRALLLFIVPPVTGAILQVLFYGLSLNWPAMMISVVIIYLQIQDRGLHTDHLTGIANRRHFEKIINSRIRRNQLDKFAVIIADLDGFKRINDQFGHDVGDEALLTAVRLLRNSLRRDDLIARFGGDEFYILLDISDETILQTLVNRIDREFVRYNERSGLPYQMSVSMGSAIYAPETGLDATQFLRQVDQLMYHEKSRRQTKLRGG